MERIERTLSIYTSGVVGIIVSILHYGMSLLANRFQDLYSGFGAELPALTRLVLFDSFFYWAMPLFIVVMLLAHHAGWVPRSAVLICSGLGTVTSILLTILCVYLPVFSLGAVV